VQFGAFSQPGGCCLSDARVEVACHGGTIWENVRVALWGRFISGSALTLILSGIGVMTPLNTHVPVASVGMDSSVGERQDPGTSMMPK